jgi:preprotein translocase subunit SecD
MLLCVVALLTHCIDSMAADDSNRVVHYEIAVDRVDDRVRVEDEGVDSLVTVLEDRLGGMGQVKLSRKNHIEIHIKGDPTQATLDSINRRVLTVGLVEFRYVANSRIASDRSAIEQAQKLPQKTSLLRIGLLEVAEWAYFPEKDFAPDYATDYHFVIRKNAERREVLKLMDSLNLTGMYITDAKHHVDKDKSSALEFTFNERGSLILSELTSRYYIADGDDNTRFLALFMDNRFIGGLPIQASISGNVVINGLSRQEVEDILSILNSGTLLFPLRSATRPVEE